MEVTPGYKVTEVGVIPDEWDLVAAGEIGRFRGGSGFPLRYQGEYSGAYPFFKVSDMNNEGNETFMRTSNHYIGETTRKTLGATLFPTNSIVFAKVGAAVFLERKRILAQTSCLDNNMAAYELDNSKADHRFIHYRLLQTRFGELVSTTALPSLSGKVLSAIRLPLPPLDEQRAIAEALSDVDALLTQLDRIISKKRDLKQAAMQQLLTGKTRLPGFSGEWQVRRLGEHVTFLRNGVHSRAELAAEGSVKYLHYGDIHTSERVRLDPLLTPMPCLPAHKATTLDRLRTGDLVFADASEDMEGVGKSVEIGTIDDGSELVSGLHTIAARFDQNILADGFKAYLQFFPAFRRQLYRLAAGTKVYATTRNHIASIELALPCVAEQTAIATILSDLDAELAALEARRDKTCALKQGMMQELLTGKTRLV